MRRRLWARPAPADIVELWPQARQVVFVERRWEPRRVGAKRRGTRVHCYLVTGPKGLRRFTPKALAALIRGHWGIENRHFHVKDRTQREDDQHARTGAITLACMRSVATTLIQSVSLTGRRRSYAPEKRLILHSRFSRLLALVLKPIH